MRTQPHILFADDDPDTRDLVQVVLEIEGFQVSTTDTTGNALRLASTERFDAMLFDYWMPEVSGIELCRQIRKFDQTTPILLVSGAVSPDDKAEAFLAGAQAYVNKPFDPKDLIRVLRSSLN